MCSTLSYLLLSRIMLVLALTNYVSTFNNVQALKVSNRTVITEHLASKLRSLTHYAMLLVRELALRVPKLFLHTICQLIGSLHNLSLVSKNANSDGTFENWTAKRNSYGQSFRQFSRNVCRFSLFHSRSQALAHIIHVAIFGLDGSNLDSANDPDSQHLTLTCR